MKYDQKQIAEWAAHECDKDASASWLHIGHAERRELAQRLIAETKLTNVANKWREEQSVRAEKAEAEEKQARAAYYEKDAELARCEGVLAKAEAARDTLAAALVPFATPIKGEFVDYRVMRACEALDTHVPGWMEK